MRSLFANGFDIFLETSVLLVEGGDLCGSIEYFKWVIYGFWCGNSLDLALWVTDGLQLIGLGMKGVVVL